MAQVEGYALEMSGKRRKDRHRHSRLEIGWHLAGEQLDESFVCPHAAIRPFVLTDEELAGIEGLETQYVKAICNLICQRTVTNN